MAFLRLTMHDGRALLLNTEIIDSIFEPLPTAKKAGVGAGIETSRPGQDRSGSYDVKESVGDIHSMLDKISYVAEKFVRPKENR